MPEGLSLGRQSSTKMRRIEFKQAQQGIALVLVLWVLTLLGVIATSFAKSMHTETELARQLTLSAQAQALAEAGIYRGIVDLLMLRRNPLVKWQANGSVYKTIKMGQGKVQIAIQDEAGRIDLNSAQEPLLNALLLASGMDEQVRATLVDAIIDWRDPDNLRRLHGAEDEEYQAAGLTYGAKDGPFNSVEELNQVLGMTPALYRRLAPALTVHSHQPNVDINFASAAVVQALEAGEAAQAGIGTDYKSILGKTANLGTPRPPRGTLVSAGSGTYTLRATAKVYGTVAEIVATIKLDGGSNQPYSVISWREEK
jgi:general secretion pathway protein K